MDYQERADELEREADAAGEANERAEREAEQARSDWEAKKSDESAPGAAEPEATGPHQLEGEEDPASGEDKTADRQAEVEDAARVEAEKADDEREG